MAAIVEAIDIEREAKLDVVEEVAGPDQVQEVGDVKASSYLLSAASAVFEQRNVQQAIRDALIKHGFETLSRTVFGLLAGMNTEEMKFLDLLWDPSFDDGWLYLSDEMIRMQITNDQGSHAYKHFCNRVLLAGDYTENVDYKMIEYDDPLIILYNKINWTDLSSSQRPKKIPNKKYFAVTGDTYSDLLSRASTDKGKLARATFRKVVKASRMMVQYNNIRDLVTSHARALEKDSAIAAAEARVQAEHDARVKAERLIHKLEEEKRGPTEYQPQVFYIASNDGMRANHQYKFGVTDAPSTVDRRQSAYKCGYAKGYEVKMIYMIETPQAKGVEAHFKYSVQRYLETPGSEIVILRFRLIKLLADRSANAMRGNIDDLISMEHNFLQILADDDPLPPYWGESAPVLAITDGTSQVPVNATSKPFSCSKCGKGYETKGWITKHERTCKVVPVTAAIAA